ncbi:MAG: hypothetical protein KAH10_08350 [Flavobacteriales bacterium]|nr:hypothetical protein [Flavobacteriales bacterium]
MKNLKKVVLMSFAIIAVTAITFVSSNATADNTEPKLNTELASIDNSQQINFDWSDYNLNSPFEAEKCGSGKCGDDKKKAETKKESKKCGEGKCGEGKCGKDTKSTEKKAEKKTEKKSEKCGAGKCGKA